MDSVGFFHDGIDSDRCEHDQCAYDGPQARALAGEEKHPGGIEHRFHIGQNGGGGGTDTPAHAQTEQHIAHAQANTHDYSRQKLGQGQGKPGIKGDVEKQQTAEQIAQIGIGHGVRIAHAGGKEHHGPGQRGEQAQCVAQKPAAAQYFHEAQQHAAQHTHGGNEVCPGGLLTEHQEGHENHEHRHGILQHDGVGRCGEPVGIHKQQGRAQYAEGAQQCAPVEHGTETFASKAQQQHRHKRPGTRQGEGMVGNVFSQLYEICENTGVNIAFFKAAIKMIAIAYITQFASEIAKDSGEGAIAKKIEFAGKVTVLVTMVPIIKNLIDVIVNTLMSF